MRPAALILLAAWALLGAGCASPIAQDNTGRLIRHPEFNAAARHAPRFTSEALQTITSLEEQLARRP